MQLESGNDTDNYHLRICVNQVQCKYIHRFINLRYIMHALLLNYFFTIQEWVQILIILYG